MAITFKELSEIAQIHYQKLPAPFKKKASEFFDALDADGDGLLTLPELLESGLVMKFSKEFVRHVFFSLDEEGKGHLEFPECMTLYYICMYSNRTCSTCSRAILQGLGYTCFKCHKEGSPNFTLCLDCFASRRFEHEHGHLHLLHDFVLFDNLLQSKPSSPPRRPAPAKPVEQTVKQCIVCGDFHESGTRGFMCDVHMTKMRASNDSVCEWCFSYFCSKCGNLFRDSSTRAEPGKWLQRFVCPSCHQNQVSSDCYEASLKRLQSLLSTAELLQHCKTCEIKQRNGTLFWIVNGSNVTASMSSTGNPPISRSSSEQVNASSAGSGPPASAAADAVSRAPSANSYFPRNSHQIPGQRNPSMIQEVASTLRAFNKVVGLVDRAANVIGGGVDGGGGGIDVFSAGGGADVLSAANPLSDSSSWDT